MIAGKKVLALTPARGGSKGLPGKNTRPFLGKPLLAHTIETSQQSKYIDRIIVSTDSKEIAQVATQFGCETSMRPAHLATDSALVIDTIRDLINRLEEKFDYLILLQATSPLRQVALIDQCIEQLIEQKADSIATFSRAEPPPSQLWNIDNNRATPYFENADPWLPRQKQQAAYHLNGLVYAFHIPTWIKSNSKTIFFANSIAFVTTQIDVDIDTLEDFELAEHIMKARS